MGCDPMWETLGTDSTGWGGMAGDPDCEIRRAQECFHIGRSGDGQVRLCTGMPHHTPTHEEIQCGLFSF